MLRRLPHDHDEFRGEVIFTFDGDAAGQKAALRAFGGDQNFVGQTYVAVEPTGLDPCDLRLQQGDAAVRELVARRVPLYRFVLGNVVSAATTSTGPTAGSTRCARRPSWSPRSATGPRSSAFARELAGMVGVDVERGPRGGPRAAASRPPAPATAAPGSRARRPRRQAPRRRGSRCPTCATRGSSLERETLKLVVQHPAAVGRTAQDVGADDFTHPTYRAVWELVDAGRRPGRRADAELGRRGCATAPPTRRSPRRSRRWPSSRCRPARAPTTAYVASTRLPAAGAHRACAGSPS